MSELKNTEEILSQEFSETFVEYMKNRMWTSYYKYGSVKSNYETGKIDALASLQQRIEKYKETKNTEFLVDVANFAMIEFMYPSLDGAFFKSTDSDESPGRVERS